MVKQNKFISNDLCSFYIWHLGKSNFLFKNISSFYKVCSCVILVGYSFIMNQCFSLVASAKVMAIYLIFLDKSDLIKPVYSILELEHSIIKPCSPALYTTTWLCAGKSSASDCYQSILLKSGLSPWRVHQFEFCMETLSVNQREKALRPVIYPCVLCNMQWNVSVVTPQFCIIISLVRRHFAEISFCPLFKQTVVKPEFLDKTKQGTPLDICPCSLYFGERHKTKKVLFKMLPFFSSLGSYFIGETIWNLIFLMSFI